MVVFRLPTDLSFNAYSFEVGKGTGMSKNGMQAQFLRH